MRYDSTMANALNLGLRDELTLLIQDLGLSLPTDDLKHAWETELRGLAQAQTLDELALRFSQAGNRAAALYEADDVGSETYRALESARSLVYSQALARIEARS